MELKRSDKVVLLKSACEHGGPLLGLRILSQEGNFCEFSVCGEAGVWFGRLVGPTGDSATAGALWDKCSKWEWAHYVLEKLGAPIYNRCSRAQHRLYSPRGEGMDEIRRHWTPFKEDLEYGSFTSSAQELERVRHRLRGYYDAAKDKALDELGMYIGPVSVQRHNARIAANVHLLVETLWNYAFHPSWVPIQLHGASMEHRGWLSNEAGWITAENALAAYHAAIAEEQEPDKTLPAPLQPCPFCGNRCVNFSDSGFKQVCCRHCGASGPANDHSATDAVFAWNRAPRAVAEKSKPERGQKFRNKKTGAVLLLLNDNTTTWAKLGYDLEDNADYLMVAEDEFERDWEPVEG